VPDNLGYTPGTGATLRTLDVGGVHYPAGTLFDGAGNVLASATTTPGASDRGLVVRAAGTVTTADVELPTYFLLTGESAMAASKLHVVAFNAAGSSIVVRVRMIVCKPTAGVVTGAISTALTLYRRALTNTPVGSGSSAVATDTADATLSAFNVLIALTTNPTGSASTAYTNFIPQPDEVKLSTLDAPTMASMQDFGGVVIYDHARLKGTKPITLRAAQSLEISQTGSAGVGNLQFLFVVTSEAA